jgi:hypothetical protein
VRRAWIVLSVSCAGAAPASSPSPPAGTGASGAPRAALEGIDRVAPPGRCGGAKIPDDYQPPPFRPQPGATIQVFPGTTYGGGTPAIELVTDSVGRFAATLPTGSYCIVRSGRGPVPTQGEPHKDLGCLVAEWHRCDLVVNVPVTTTVALDHRERCSWAEPCYDGPEPP